MATLIHLSYSPWSEKARWALDHHDIKVQRVHYVPMLGVPGLRLRLRRFRGRVTVPVLIDGIERFDDSIDIARWADARGSRAPLFPKHERTRVEQWVDRSEQIMALGRARACRLVSLSPKALRESVPQPLNRVAPLARATGWFGLRYLHRKYDLSSATAEALDAELHPLLSHVKSSLAGRRYLLEQFSFADIAIAASLQFINPVPERYLRLGTASRAAWTSAALSEAFRGLLDWRDELYEEHR